jgi:hypothetical protein
LAPFADSRYCRRALLRDRLCISGINATALISYRGRLHFSFSGDFCNRSYTTRYLEGGLPLSLDPPASPLPIFAQEES